MSVPNPRLFVACSSGRCRGIHDPHNAAVKTLQPPAEAMKGFPRDGRGIVNWVETLNSGVIQPRTGLTGKEKMHSVDFDVIFKKADMAKVVFIDKT